TGFAHLFEHLMFEGSEQMEKAEAARLVEQNGGVFNGSTRYDFTNYFEAMPAHALELALWMEADRMRGPRVTQHELDNQRDVVKNEIRVNVTNQPYGGFPWITMAQHAFANWNNAHNGYGDMVDLDAARLEDVKQFFDDYYSPSNAVLVITGDFEPAEALALATRHFGSIPARPVPPTPDLTEPRQTAERRVTDRDPLATRPALAVSYHTPPRDSQEYYALGLLDDVLLQGDDSLLHQALVKRRGLTSQVEGGINFLGHMHNASTPLLWTTWLIHDPGVVSDDVLAAIDEVIATVRAAPLEDAAFARALVKARSGYYDTVGDYYSFPMLGRADMLASCALFDDDPGLINRIPERFDALTPDILLETAREYLRPDNRTVIALEAGGANEAEAEA
ncbi:MAG: pitrilysin family protein, partial [Chloroflexi bacterium]|nr:pitrilysin family protein [Chloroflexota bacterium]